ncbi:MAG: hypothetical protein KJ025_00760 [Burkholderiales bacterium]|nr:hypothetical protein [Burkholderiales bacterium]
MSRHAPCGIGAALAAALVLIVLTGCAAGPSSGQAVEWVVWQEAEKKRLDDMGFPQYNDGGN